MPTIENQDPKTVIRVSLSNVDIKEERLAAPIYTRLEFIAQLHARHQSTSREREYIVNTTCSTADNLGRAGKEGKAADLLGTVLRAIADPRYRGVFTTDEIDSLIAKYEHFSEYNDIIKGKTTSIEDEGAQRLFEMMDTIALVAPEVARMNLFLLFKKFRENADTAVETGLQHADAAQQTEYAIFVYERVQKAQPEKPLPDPYPRNVTELLDQAIEEYRLAARDAHAEGDYESAARYTFRMTKLAGKLPSNGRVKAKLERPHVDLEQLAELGRFSQERLKELEADEKARYHELSGAESGIANIRRLEGPD